jgi:alpha-L-fucosidase
MTERKLKNWLDSYMEYTADTEPAKVFHHWVGMSIMAAALRKKTYVKYGRLRYYPNLYVVLVAEPGVARKSQAINFGVEIMSQVPEIQMSADAITKEALLVDLV